jgi:hypothetical protein
VLRNSGSGAEFVGEYMEQIERIKKLSERIPQLLESIKTEEATKQYLIIPFIQALGYDVFDPREVCPEYDANVGASKKYKLDYAIFKDGKPIILIECKQVSDNLANGYSQLFHYFAATNARIGVLTNGIIYKFYADLDTANKMDENPFLEIDMLSINNGNIDELQKITKDAFDIEKFVFAATELKYVARILDILNTQMTAPTEDFAKIFFNKICPDKSFSITARTQFVDYTKRGLRQFVRSQVSNMFDATGFPPTIKTEAPILDTPIISGDLENQTEKNKIVTTLEENEAFYIVKAILREAIDPQRIVARDTQSYFGVLLDDNNRKPICRLYLPEKGIKRLGLFKDVSNKIDTRIDITNINDIFKYADELKRTVVEYDTLTQKAS